jgi:hypothetical protein
MLVFFSKSRVGALSLLAVIPINVRVMPNPPPAAMNLHISPLPSAYVFDAAIPVFLI